MATKKHFFAYGSFSIRDGSEIHFWEDKWLGTTTLREQYPALYKIVRHKDVTLQYVMETSPPSMTLRRNVVGPQLTSWNELLQKLASVQLVQGKDIFLCELNKNGIFSVKSMYEALIEPIEAVYNNKNIWKLRMPLKTNRRYSLGTYAVVLFSPKIILQNAISMAVRNVFSIKRTRQ
jgi:hypothetical protein